MTSTRTFTLTREKNFTIPSKGLISKWSVLSIKQLDKDGNRQDISSSPPSNIYIDNILIPFPSLSISHIRQTIRDTFPETDDDLVLENLERKMYENQIIANEFYPKVSSKDFFNSLFNRDLLVRLKVDDEKVDEVEVEEEYFVREQMG